MQVENPNSLLGRLSPGQMGNFFYKGFCSSFRSDDLMLAIASVLGDESVE